MSIGCSERATTLYPKTTHVISKIVVLDMTVIGKSENQVSRHHNRPQVNKTTGITQCWRITRVAKPRNGITLRGRIFMVEISSIPYTFITLFKISERQQRGILVELNCFP